MVSVATERRKASLSTLSENREGIVEQVSEFLRQHEANLEATYSVEFGGDYGLHFYFSASPQRLQEIEREYASALSELSPVLRTEKKSVTPPGMDRLFEVIVYSYDQEGLIARVAGLLAKDHVDIQALSGCSFSAPFAGSQMFVAKIKVVLPDNLNPTVLRTSLENLANDHGWSLYLEPLSVDMERVQHLLRATRSNSRVA